MGLLVNLSILREEQPGTVASLWGVEEGSQHPIRNVLSVTMKKKTTTTKN